MNYPNPKNGLFEQFLKQDHKLEFQEAVAVPHLLMMPAHGVTFGLPQIMPNINMSTVITSYRDAGSIAQFIIDYSNIADRRHMIHDATIDRLYKKWQPHRKQFLDRASNLDKVSLADYLKLYKLYYHAYLYAMPTEWFTAFFSDEIIGATLKRHHHLASEIHEITKPLRLSFLQEEEKELLQLALQQPVSEQKLKQHQRKWHWIYNNYRDTQELPIDFFKNRLQQLNQQPLKELRNRVLNLENYEANHAESVEQIIKSSKIDLQTIKILLKIGFVASMQDQRKQVNLLGDWMLNRFLKMASKKYEWPFELLQYTLPQEFAWLLENKKLDEKTLRQRYQACVEIVSEDGFEEILGGKAALIVIEQVNKLWQTGEKEVVHGIAASPGKMSGTVRIVTDPNKEGRFFQTGEVLVTSMTRPDMVPIMRKAVAIVTNEGGITSHAAIISRELGIPCIIGTKTATKVFKDGDMVEVDANKGVVKKIL